MRKSVREAHDGGARRFECSAIAEAVYGVEPLVRIADERKRQDRLTKVSACALEQVARDLDHFRLGGPEGLVSGADSVCVDTAKCTCEPAREPEHHVGAAAVRREINDGST